MKKKHILFSTIISMGMMVSSCSDYLSVEGKLGENTQSLENIFENKEWSEQWLATAYAWLTWSNIDIGSKDNCITNFSDDMCYSDRNLEYRVNMMRIGNKTLGHKLMMVFVMPRFLFRILTEIKK